jgi:hypothetical protein
MKCRKAAILVISALLPLAVAVLPASAATVTYDWTLTGPAASLGGFVWTGSGTVTVTTGSGDDTITAITGSVTNGTITDPITGLATSGGVDNLLFPIGTTFTGPPVVHSGSYVSASDLDTEGLGFTIAAGTIDVFGGYQPNSTDVTAGNNYDETGPGGFGVGTFALTATPLPAALPLFAGGLGMLGLFGRRRKSKASQAVAAA